MEAAAQRSKPHRRKALLKALILVVFILFAIGLIRFTPIRGYLSAEGLGRFLDTAGFWAPVVYMAIYAVGVCLFVPGTLLTGLGAAIFGDRLGKYDDAIERNGFAAVLYLRLVYFPFTPLNFGMGLTKVHFGDYFFGTGLGIIVGTFIFTFFIGTLKEVWASGNWGELLSLQVFFSIALFVSSFFIPKIIKKVKGAA